MADKLNTKIVGAFVFYRLFHCSDSKVAIVGAFVCYRSFRCSDAKVAIVGAFVFHCCSTDSNVRRL